MFDTLPQRASAVDACMARLRDAILEGRIAIGDRLPPERDLAATFGVNRVTVRSALGRLASLGLVTVRQGSGYVVRDFRRVGGPDLAGALCELARKNGALAPIARDLLFVRSCLAEGVLRRLAEARPSDAAIGRIAEAVDAFAARASEGATAAEIAALDLEVLGLVLDATESPVLRLFLNPVTSLLADLPELVGALYARPERNVLAYRALLAWLASPSPDLVGPIVAAMRARDEEALAMLNPTRKKTTPSRTPRRTS
jgi:DNA-binding FadR family transcriptional regulator